MAGGVELTIPVHANVIILKLGCVPHTINAAGTGKYVSLIFNCFFTNYQVNVYYKLEIFFLHAAQRFRVWPVAEFGALTCLGTLSCH